MSDSLVSCVCVTYGRPVLLGEAIKCFIDQDYSNKELIVVNDQEGVTLSLDTPRDDIQIHNVAERFGSLGEKRNYAMSLAKGDNICIWDDDDLYTPWRLSDSVREIEKQKCDIVKATQALMTINNGTPRVVNNLFHSQACISRQYVDKMEYLQDRSVGEDMEYEKNARITSVHVNPFFWYVYRWGMNIHHLSGIADDKKSWDKALDFEPYKEVQGEVTIKPEFQNDYWKDIGEFLVKGQSWEETWEEKIKKALDRNE